jgi:hypothetical protein
MLKSAENFSFSVTLSAICVISIAENAKNFAEDRREEGRCLTFENKTPKNAKGKILKYNGHLHSLNRFNLTGRKNTSNFKPRLAPGREQVKSKK